MFISGLGAYPFKAIVNFVSPVPPGGLTESVPSSDQYTTSRRVIPVPRIIPASTVAAAYENPDWMPPGWTIQGTANALLKSGAINFTWAPPLPLNKTTFLASKPSGAYRQTTRSTNDQYNPSAPVVYYSSPQYELDVGLWFKFGVDAGYITLPKDDWVSKAIQYTVEAIVIAGIAYGAWLAAAQATAAAPSATAPTAAAPTAAAPATTVSAETVTTGATATGAGTTGTTAAGVAKAAAGYAAQAKDVYGVAQLIRSVTSQPPQAAPAPSLDTTYGGGSGSGGGAGGSGGAGSWLTQLTSGNNPLYIGLGLAVIFVVFTLSQPSHGKRRG